MAGLLDGAYSPDPLSMGLLGLGSALMTPRAMGGGIGPGMQQFAQGAMQAQMLRRQQQQDELQRKLFDLRLSEAAETAEDRKRKREMEAALQKAARDAVTPASPGSLGGGVAPGSQQGQMLLSQMSGDPVFDAAMLGGTNAALNSVGPQQPVSAPTAGGFDTRAFLNNLRAAGMPLEAARYEKEMAVDDKPFVVDGNLVDRQGRVIFSADKPQVVNGQVVRLRDMASGTQIPQQAPFEYEPDPQNPGRFRIRPEVLAAKTQVARAGATNIGLPKIELKTGESMAGQIGPMLRDSATATQGAVNMADAAQRTLTAIERGGVIAGPGASLRLRGAQVASLFGFGGKDAVAQTRQVVRALAESSIEARKELAGQGQVTENEAKAVQKAMSGDIDDLTVEEIRDISRLNIRAAVMRAQRHNEMLQSVPDSAAGLRPFYAVPRAGELLRIDPKVYSADPPAPAAGQGGWGIQRVQ